MNLEQVKARMTTRDHWMLLDEAGRAFVIQGLADDVPGLVQEIERLAGIADRANKAMEKHQKHNGALEIGIQEAHRELDGAVKDGNRLADALVKSREEVVALKLQNQELQKNWATRAAFEELVKKVDATNRLNGELRSLCERAVIRLASMDPMASKMNAAILVDVKALLAEGARYTERPVGLGDFCPEHGGLWSYKCHACVERLKASEKSKCERDHETPYVSEVLFADGVRSIECGNKCGKFTPVIGTQVMPTEKRVEPQQKKCGCGLTGDHCHCGHCPECEGR